MSNLTSIVAAGGLRCTSEMQRLGVPHTNIAYDHIQQRRATRAVSCGRGGTLHDYVPFFFCARPPMLYTISRGNVGGRSQDSIVYLVSSVEQVEACGLEYVFTNGHGTMAITEFFTDRADLGRVDWPLMQERYWNDTAADPDRKRRRQAEFLVRDFVPVAAFTEIVVMKQALANEVEQIWDSDRPITVAVRREWYY